MSIVERSLFNASPRNAGEVSVHHPKNFTRTLITEGVIKFGRAAMLGTTPQQAKLFAGSSKTFRGVSKRSFEATGLDVEDTNTGTTGRYEDKNVFGLTDSGLIAVFVEEAVDPTSPVRVRHSQEATSAGLQEISSTPTGFVGATVPAIASATYDIDIDIDGTPYQVGVAILNTDDWDTIAAAIQTALRVLTSALETVQILAGRIRVTSVTTGASSTVDMADGTLGSGGGGLLAYIDASIANMTTTIETAQDGSDDPSLIKEPGNFATTAEGGKTTLLDGARYETTTTASGLVILKLDGRFTTTDD